MHDTDNPNERSSRDMRCVVIKIAAGCLFEHMPSGHLLGGFTLQFLNVHRSGSVGQLAGIS